ncbi:MAG: histidine phosphatase family protein [Acidobacteria bacterium]|nr:histidine phosphatase family protein [Acidobacteriota bacterium]
MKCRSVVVFLLLVCLAPVEAYSQKAIILVRHTERLDQSQDSVLAPIGVERARRLAAHLKDAGITAIYTSERKRTIQTAEPLADLSKKKPIPIGTSADLVSRIKRENADDVVLIVGHSNTVPELITAFGAVEKITIPDSEHDNIFILVPQSGGRPALLIRLRY